MRILDFEYHGVAGDEWHFSTTGLKRVNLLVGDTGSGKTRFLNALFNMAMVSVSNDLSFQPRGKWTVRLSIGGADYLWHLHSDFNSNKEVAVKQEKLVRQMDSNETIIIERTEHKHYFLGKPQPKLTSKVSSISLFQNEEMVKPVYQGFSSMIRRSFSDEGLINSFAPQGVSKDLYQSFRNANDLFKVFSSPFQANVRLSLLQEISPSKYDSLVSSYRKIFPFVGSTRIVDITQSGNKDVGSLQTPIFYIKETSQTSWIRSTDLSSGMQKVLLILLDTVLLPQGGVYLIDEYENSLGINAINFLPNFLLESDENNQFFITSHHPYIINAIGIDSWLVFHRQGTRVLLKHGSDLKEKYGKSKQEQFIQLVNDPFYSRGVE